MKKKIEIYSIQKSVKLVYEDKVKFFVPEAVKKLQNHQNDWIFCTDLGLSLEDINQPQTMAAWVAYYQFGQQYCKQWWKWPKNDPCSTMKEQAKNITNNNKIKLLKKITLCQIARKNKV